MTNAPHWVEEYFGPPGPALNNASTGTMHNVPTTEGPHRRRNHRFTGVAPTITGLASGAAGRPITIFAVGGDVVLKNENAGSLAANRIVTGAGGDFTIPEGAAAEVVYDEQSTRWRVVSGDGGGGGELPGRVTVTFADANIDLTGAPYSLTRNTIAGAIIKLDGSTAVVRDLTFPLPASAAESYFVVLERSMTGASSVRLRMSAGGTWTLANAQAVAAGAMSVAGFTPDGVTVTAIAEGLANEIQMRGSSGYVNARTGFSFDGTTFSVPGTETAWKPTAATNTEEHAQLTEYPADGTLSTVGPNTALSIAIPDGYSTDHIVTVQCIGSADQYLRRTWRASWMRDGTRFVEKDVPNSSGDASANTSGFDATFARSGNNAVLTVTGIGRWTVQVSRLRTRNWTAPVLDSVTPGTGVPAGGETVTLAGARFIAGAEVTFGGTAATAENVVSANSMTCVTPAKAAGTYDVVITNPDTKTATKTGGFTYASAAFDPATLTLTGWWRASYAASPWTGTASAGTSNTRNLTEATNAPGVFAIGSYNAADFDGTNDKLTYSGTGDDLYDAGAGGVAVLYRADTLAAPYGALIDDAINEPGLLVDVGAYFAIGVNSTGPKIAILDGTYKGHQRADGNVTGTWYLLMVRWNGTNLESCINGGAWTTTACGTIDNVATAMKVGTRYAETAIFYDGKIAELMTQATAWTDGNRADLVGYVNARYGLAL